MEIKFEDGRTRRKEVPVRMRMLGVFLQGRMCSRRMKEEEKTALVPETTSYRALHRTLRTQSTTSSEEVRLSEVR